MLHDSSTTLTACRACEPAKRRKHAKSNLRGCVVVVEESANRLSPKHQFGKGQKLPVDADLNCECKCEYAPVLPYLYPPLSIARGTVR